MAKSLEVIFQIKFSTKNYIKMEDFAINLSNFKISFSIIIYFYFKIKKKYNFAMRDLREKLL